MPCKTHPFILCFCLSAVVAHVPPKFIHREISSRQAGEAATQWKPEISTASQNIQADVFKLSAISEQSTLHQPSQPSQLKPEVKSNCQVMLVMLAVICLCGACISESLGQTLGCVVLFCITFSMVYYILTSGIWESWRSGQNVGIPCAILCLWVAALLCVSCLCICFLCCGFTTMLNAWWIIKNAVVKQMHDEYESHKEKLSGPRRDYYESEAFKQRCDKLFDRYDKDESGSLTMQEILPLVQKEWELDEESAQQASLFLFIGFDENKGGSVERAEFVHLMQYMAMKRFQEGQFTQKSAYEVLQLDPDSATYEDFKKSYKKLSLKYHPDKRQGVPEEEVKRDMAEINDAKTLLEKLPRFQQKQQVEG
jgi:hypothetical protein